jgi:hypothetical protein
MVRAAAVISWLMFSLLAPPLGAEGRRTDGDELAKGAPTIRGHLVLGETR